MNIDKFIEWIECQKTYIYRGDLINKLAYQMDDWCITLRALLIKNLQSTIYKSYLLEKLRFMKNHPDNPFSFLDGFGIRIYLAIKDYNNI